MLKGGSSGPVIVPGDPDASLLIKAVRYRDADLQMPPKDKKLADDQIANLEAWVKMGAPDPRVSTGPKPLTDVAEARARHWAFQPVTKPAPPSVKKPRWVQTPVDNFILAKLEAKGLKQITDTGAIEKVIDEIMAANPKQLADYRSGKDKLFGFFVGQVMKVTGGKANPAQVNDLLKRKLAG